MLQPIFKFFTLFLSLFLVFLTPASAQNGSLDIKDVRFGAHPDKTRMVIELSEKVDYRAFMLPQEGDKPYRLVIDLPNFEWRAGAIAPAPKTPVMDVRSGTLNTTTKRIVVDLKNPAEISEAFILPAPNRLVIDFKTMSVQQFQNSERKLFGSLTDTPAPVTLSQILSGQTPQPTSTNVANDIVTPPRKPAVAQKSIISSPTPSRQTPLRTPLIVVDAGHGGADPGAAGSRAYEKNVTLSAAKALKQTLESTGRYRVHLTRDTDKYLKLYERRTIARQMNADLFISLHADSIDKPTVRGASIYTLSDKSSDAQTAKLAARENQADLIAGVDLSHEDKDVASILIDLAMRDTMNQSKFFANTVVENMNKNGIKLLPKPHRYAGFAVLKSPDVPSVLVEMGFMSNKSDVQMLSSQDYQLKIASTLTKAIDSYFDKLRKNSLE